MARINFIVPTYSRDQFTGGLWCILEYAHGLHKRGHTVCVIPIAPAPRPEWFALPFGNLINSSKTILFKRAVSTALLEIPGLFHRRTRSRSIRKISAAFSFPIMTLFPTAIQWGIAEAYLPIIAPRADVNIATGFFTARPTAILPGRNFYFVQHYEPYLAGELPESDYAAAVARQSYKLGLEHIANSSWLRNKLISEGVPNNVHLCPNAIDHKVFTGSPKRSFDSCKVVVISYGGRQAEWKGFRDMAAAVAIARARVPNIEIEWRVYGDSLLPPNNPVASYVPLGFLSPTALSDAYRRADILLSASWYESFPLFPIEAMACGLAVVTTQFGTEEYAEHGVTAEIVEPRCAESIATGLLKLIEDPEYRFGVASAGNQLSRQFTWERSVAQFERIVTES